MKRITVEMVSDDKRKQRFWAKVRKTPTCWQWIGAKTGLGYGIMRIGSKLYLAHRLVWVLMKKQVIGAGLEVLHKCDNPSCVRPGHLFVGTPQDNRRDQYNKGRVPSGEKHGRSVLTQCDVAAIRYARNVSCRPLKQLSRKFGVSVAQISSIATYRTWRTLQ